MNSFKKECHKNPLNLVEAELGKLEKENETVVYMKIMGNYEKGNQEKNHLMSNLQL